MARRPHPSDSYAAKKARAKRLGYSSVRAMREAKKPGRLTVQQKSRREGAFATVARARRDRIPIAEAARLEGSTVAAVHQWAPTAITREHGRLVATRNDRLARPLLLVTTEGELTAIVRSARLASIVGSHHAAIGEFLVSGDDEALLGFRGRRVAGYELEADSERIFDLYLRGGVADVGLEGIYRWERAA